MKGGLGVVAAGGLAPVIPPVQNVVVNNTAIISMNTSASYEGKGNPISLPIFDLQASYYTTSTGAFLRTGALISNTLQGQVNDVGVGESIRWTYWYKQRTTGVPIFQYVTALVPRT